MSGPPLRIFNRYSGRYETEQIAGEKALRLLYGGKAGRAFTGALVCRPFLSRIFGWYMRRPVTDSRIAPFIEKYGIDASEFSEPVAAYRSFNDFFTRRLKPEARPIHADPRSLVFPGDARHLACPRLGGETGVFVKGQRWNVSALLGGDRELVDRYTGGTLVMSRLCPVDYHHFHYPAGGRLLEGSRWIDGRLFSVNPLALGKKLGYLWRNKRFLSLMDAGAAGTVCLIAVGATNVGSIGHCPTPPDGSVRKGDRKGWFEFGGSCFLTLFEPDRVRLEDDLLEKSAEGVELYAHFGDIMGMSS